MRRALIGLAVVAAASLLLIAAMTVRLALLPQARPAAADAPPLAIDRAAAVDRLSRALQFETVSTEDPAERNSEPFARFHAFLAEAFPLVHERLERHEIGLDALLYIWRGSGGDRPYLLLAHQDVVPPGDLDAWTYPPFSGALAAGHVWGRGALDDKGSLTAALEAVEHLLERGFAPRRTVYLAFGADEEVGGQQGAVLIAQRLLEDGVTLDFVIDEGLTVTEGVVPGIDAPVALIGLAEKGSLTLKLRAEGAGGHSSMPPPISAPGRIGRAIARLEAKPMPASLEGVPERMLRRLAPHMDFPQGLVAGNLWLTAPLVRQRFGDSPATNALIRTTTAVSMLRAGLKQNVLAASAEATVNFRLRPGDSGGTVVDHVRAAIDDPKVRLLGSAADAREATPVSSAEAAAYATIERSIAATFPDALVAPGLVLAGTDSRHFVGIADNVYRFAPYRLGPDDLARLHGFDERIAVEDYIGMIRFYARLIEIADGP